MADRRPFVGLSLTDKMHGMLYASCMPRTARVFQKSLCYHVMNRGVNRQAIFSDDEDRAYFSKTVAEYSALCSAKVYHWVWMGNHMLIEVVSENLRGFVGGIQQAYAQYHHARHKGAGVFWQGRFKSKPVESGPYLAACGRYIERNPVRAGLTEIAQAYPWSSAAAYVSQKVDGITHENPHMGPLSQNDRIAYSDALASGTDDAVVRSMRGRRALGDNDFASLITPPPSKPQAEPFAELRAGDTYYGKVWSIRGSMVAGYITWENATGFFKISTPPRGRSTAIWVRMPFSDVKRFRFRELTPEERLKWDNQNKALVRRRNSR